MTPHIGSIKELEQIIGILDLPRFDTTDEHKLGDAPMNKPVEYAEISCLRNNFYFAPYDDSFATIEAYVIGLGQLKSKENDDSYDYIISSIKRFNEFTHKKRDEDYNEEVRGPITLIPLRFLHSYKTLERYT